MTKAEVAEVFAQIVAECLQLREAGQKEYAHTEDNAFNNFESIGALLELPREKILLVYAVKHLFGIIAHINGHKSQREDVRGRINDFIVYMSLLRAMIDEGENVND